MTTIAEFIAKHKITMTVERADSNPNMDDGSNRMDHWRCKLKCARRQMSLIFSMGTGHNGKEPDLKGVLDCLASDSTGIENARDFEDWASEYGFNTDSRKAERTYKICQGQAKRLRQLLGDGDAFNDLLFKTERE